jgi:hypothetical protein
LLIACRALRLRHAAALMPTSRISTGQRLQQTKAPVTERVVSVSDGSATREGCGHCEIVVADERLDSTDMVRQLFGKRSCVDSHTKGRGDHERHAGSGEAGDAMEARGLNGFRQRHRRQNGGEAAPPPPRARSSPEGVELLGAGSHGPTIGTGAGRNPPHNTARWRAPAE